MLHARSVWGRLGTLLIRYEADPKVLEMFYRAVIQAALIFGSETWVLFAEKDQKVEGTHTYFLRKITGKRAQRLTYRTWETTGEEAVQEAAGTQSVMTYIGRWKTNIAQWVALWPIFEVCAGEKV